MNSTCFRTALALAAVALLVLAGCQAPRGERLPPTERAVAAAVGVPGDAIAFRREGGDDDVSTPPRGALALPESIRRSLQHSPVLQAALAQVRSAESEALQSRLLPNPV